MYHYPSFEKKKKSCDFRRTFRVCHYVHECMQYDEYIRENEVFTENGDENQMRIVRFVSVRISSKRSVPEGII